MKIPEMTPEMLVKEEVAVKLTVEKWSTISTILDAVVETISQATADEDVTESQISEHAKEMIDIRKDFEEGMQDALKNLAARKAIEFMTEAFGEPKNESHSH